MPYLGSTSSELYMCAYQKNYEQYVKNSIEQAELKDKHKHLLQLEKSTIEERIDTAIPQENDDVLEKQ